MTLSAFDDSLHAFLARSQLEHVDNFTGFDYHLGLPGIPY
jgi:hypothetical protein